MLILSFSKSENAQNTPTISAFQVKFLLFPYFSKILGPTLFLFFY